MASSPRKTRSRSRLVSAAGDDSHDHYTSVSTNASPTPAQSMFGAHLAIPSVPVLKAASMEPAPGAQRGAEKRARHKMTDVQLQRLEELYQADTHPSREAKNDLARELGMSVKTVLIWFQNRRQDRRRKTRGSRAEGTHSTGGRKSVQKARKALRTVTPSLTRPKPPPRQLKQAKDTAFRAVSKPRPSNTTAAQAPAAGTARRGQTSLHTAPSSGEDSMDVVDGDSPSTAPTSVHARLLPRITRSPSSSLASSSSAAGSPHALWKLVCASPPPPPPLPPPRLNLGDAKDAKAYSRRPLGRIQGPRAAVAQGADLEWACANSAARRKHGCFVYRDEDDSEGESSERERDNSGPPPRKRRRDEDVARMRQQMAVEAGGHGADGGAIPREYEMLFPPDLVLGASLLLTLKHSRTPSPKLRVD
ncbi:hypothetical protein BD413DRAFT_630767 [Trametes elegans]|nr:hypothetical protein BD413DRAFT_630767 [Trametes elegans]